MTAPAVDQDVYAFNEWANEKRREKAVVVAKHLYGQQVPVDAVFGWGEGERKAQEKAAGVRTSHRDALWRVVVEVLGKKYDYEARHAPAAAPGRGPQGEPCIPHVSEATAYRCVWCDLDVPAAPSPAPQAGVAACGCPTGPGLPDWDSDKHRAWHDLVVEQGGPDGVVNYQTLRATRGLRTPAPDMHKIAARNEKAGKSSPGWRRQAAR